MTAVAKLAAAAHTDLRAIPLAAITAHPANRKRFDAGQLAELAQSLRTHGQLTPALVRRKGQGYELLAGERRYRAAGAAGLDTLLCLVRDLDDATALEILAVENNQREDVHPLEEADLFKALLTLDGYDVARIAAKLHRSVAYVYDRLKLLALGRRARQLFLDGRITVGHAVLLARLAPADQLRAIGVDPDDGQMGPLDWMDGGLFVPEDRLTLPGLEADAQEADGTPRLKARSVAELQGWIDRHVRFAVDQVQQADLLQEFPETAQALTDAQAAALQILPITYEHALRHEARAEDGSRTWGPMSWRRADGRQGSKSCAHNAHLGVLVAGPGRGQAFRICTARKVCKVHWAPEMREAARRAKERAAEAAPGAADRPAARREETWQEREAREKAQRAGWAAERRAVLDAIVAQGIPPLERLLPHLVARVFQDSAVMGAEVAEAAIPALKGKRWHDAATGTAVLATLSLADQTRAAFYALVGDDLRPYHQRRDTEHLYQVAALVGVDPKTVIAAHRKAVAAQAKAAAAAKTEAKPKAKPTSAAKPGAKAKATGKAKGAPLPRQKHGAFLQPHYPSAALAMVVGAQPLARTEVIKRLWAYVKKHKLQDAETKRTIHADDLLRPIFGGRDAVSIFDMTTLVNEQLTLKAPAAESAQSWADTGWMDPTPAVKAPAKKKSGAR